MEDVEQEGESEFDLNGGDRDSVVTITSSEFHRLSAQQEEDEEQKIRKKEDEGEDGENKQIFIEPELKSQLMPPNLFENSNSTTLSGDGPQSSQRSVPTIIFSTSGSKQLQQVPFDDSSSIETLIGPEHVLEQQPQFLTDSKSVQTKKEGQASDRPLPIYYMELKRLRREEKYDAFSEDEEPVLRTTYTPYVPIEPECPEPVIRKEKIIVYDVRGGIYRGELPSSKKFKKHGKNHSLSPSTSTALFSRSSIARRSARTIISSTPLEWKFQDLTPHQRDLRNVSFEELSSTEVSIIIGLWKCITYNLWTFGAVTTINFFRIRGHIAFSDQKATPEEMMKCRFLWPHAKQTMKSLEAVVLNLHKPEESHKLIYDLGKKHGKLKIPLSEIHSQMLVNSFLYTFYQHVHPKMTLKELNILRKFSNITMFLFMDASRWDSEPLPLY